MPTYEKVESQKITHPTPELSLARQTHLLQ